MRFENNDCFISIENVPLNNQYRVVEKCVYTREWVYDNYLEAKQKFVERVMVNLNLYPFG